MIPYLFVDQIAFQTLAAEPECQVGDRNVVVSGYETYFIEQWACERRLNRIVTSYTGNQTDEITVSVLYVPEHREGWGHVLNQYFDELSAMHLVAKETSLGRLFVTNLSSFPSNWTLVAVPKSLKFRQARDLFIVNEGLRRFHCIGRMAVSLVPPSDSATAKFRQLLKIPSEIPIMFAVREVVTLMQIALFYFDLLPAPYVDGLYCQYTVNAVDEWWKKFGKPRYKYQPSTTGNLYEATSVAALVGFIIGARYRFSLLGIKGPKDPFFADQFVSSIRQFQKSERITKTHKLDETTVWRLLEVTAKATWNNQDFISIFKSTMKEGLSGRTSSTSVHTYETSELDILVLNVKGQRAQYLWQNNGSQYTPRNASDPDRRSYSTVTGIPLESLADDDKNSKLAKQNSIVTRFRRKPLDPPPSFPNEKPRPTFTLDEESTGSENEEKSRAARLRALLSNNASSTAIAPSRSATASPIEDDEAVPSADASSHQYLRRLLTESSLLTQDDIKVGTKEPTDMEHIRRTTSLSQVEKVVFPWSTPVSAPKVRKLYDTARKLRIQLVSQMYLDNEFCDAIGKQIQDQSMKLSTEQRNSEVIKFQVTASSRKEHTVKAQIQELEAFTAKLDYEWSFLDTKLKDVEDTIDMFSKKVETIERRWESINNKEIVPLWTRLAGMLGM